MHVHYDDDYHRVITGTGETKATGRWQRHRNLIARYKQSGSILDVGCSSGAFLGTMKGDAWKLFGIEMEPATAERARARTGADIYVGDALDAPFAPESFDVITCFDLLEHVYDPRQFLTRALEWLKPGGVICLVMPNIESWEARIFGSYWYGLELPRHLFHFSPRSLRRLMSSVGFTEIYLATSASYIERSVGYVISAMIECVGITPRPASSPRAPGLAWKVVRRLLRLTVVRPFARVASIFCAAGQTEVIFVRTLSKQ